MTSGLWIPGVCSECGCTDERACAEGCSWADDDRTLCTRCAGFDERDILDACDVDEDVADLEAQLDAELERDERRCI